eukprot:g8888.t1
MDQAYLVACSMCNECGPRSNEKLNKLEEMYWKSIPSLVASSPSLCSEPALWIRNEDGNGSAAEVVRGPTSQNTGCLAGPMTTAGVGDNSKIVL